MALIRKFLSLIIVLLFGHVAARASHVAGADINWECIAPGQYRFNLVIFRDCTGSATQPFYFLRFASSCGTHTLRVDYASMTEVSPLCNAQLPDCNCNFGGTQPGMQQYVYTGVISGLAPCSPWRVSWDISYRNAAITNITNPGNTNLFVEVQMNNLDAPCNDSPRFANHAIPYVCSGQPISYSYGAYDPEADSLTYTLVGALDEDGDPVGYTAGYTSGQPIPGIDLDPTSGLVTFTAPIQGNYVVVVRVDEYDADGTWIGAVIRDMQFIVRACTNIAPDPTTGTIHDIQGDAYGTGPYAVTVCESGAFCLEMLVSDANATNILTATSNVSMNLPGATISTSGSNPLAIRVCWTAAPGTSGYFPFVIAVNDGACPVPAIQTYVYEVTVLPGLHATITATDEGCAGQNDGMVVATVDVGLAPYSYTWAHGAGSDTVLVGPGTYSVTIQDANGCRRSVNDISVGTTAQAPVANAGFDVFGCMADLPIQLNGTATNATGLQWTGGSGTYTGTGGSVTYTPTQAEVQLGGVELFLEATGAGTCPTDRDSLLLILPNSFRQTAVSTTAASCADAVDGSASVGPDNPLLSFTWTPGNHSDPTVTGIAAGNYSVVIADFFGCDTTVQLTVAAPPALLISDISTIPEQCAGQGDGQVSVSVSGGTAPYTYLWNTGDTTSTITVGAGQYGVQVSDAMGCAISSGMVQVLALGQPNAAHAGTTGMGCIDQLPLSLNGSVTNATGGSWSGGSGTFAGSGTQVTYMPSAQEIAAGTVSLVLSTTGNNTCPTATDTLHVPLSPGFANIGSTLTHVDCHGQASGSIQLGHLLPGQTFLWDDANSTTTPSIGALIAGTYSVRISDQTGCDTLLYFTLGEPAPLTLGQPTVQDEDCAGQGNGSITVPVFGGTQPYSYAWSQGDTTATAQLGAGQYTLVVTDALGCTVNSSPVVVNATGQPNQVDAGPDQVVCSNDLPVQLNGTVVHATGGTWSGGNGTWTGSGLAMSYQPSTAEISAGSVALVLTSTGNSSCPTVQDTVLISLSNSFHGGQVSTTQLLCHGANTGTATYSPAHPGLSYQWDDPFAQVSAQATGLVAGTYHVRVSDAMGCDSVFTAVINSPAAVTVDQVVTVGTTCSGSTDGSATAVVSGGSYPFSFVWSNNANGQTGQTITQLAGGNYTVTVTDSHGCTGQGSAVVQAPLPLGLSAQVVDTACVNVPVALTAQASGGTGQYFVHWAGIGTGDSLMHQFAASTTVAVQVTDEAGCIGPMLEFPLHILDLSQATLLVSGDTLICPGGQGTLMAQLTNYTGPHTFNWAQGSFMGPGPHAVQPTGDITYSVTVTDGCGNTLVGASPISIQHPPVIQLPEIIAEGCAPLAVTMPAGLTSQQVQYIWQFGDGSSGVGPTPMHTYPAGTYTVSLTVITPIGCSGQATSTGQVLVHGLPTAAFQASAWEADIDQASIVFTDISTGPAPIVNSSWSFGDGSFGDGPEVTHSYLDIGDHPVQLTVEDANGCTATITRPVRINPVYDIVVPNAFSPSLTGGGGGYYDPADLSNDVFYPFVRFVKDFDLRVYNRWGELVFESTDVRFGWDGHYRGQLCQQDVYAYKMRVRFVDDKEVLKVGDITLFR